MPAGTSVQCLRPEGYRIGHDRPDTVEDLEGGYQKQGWPTTAKTFRIKRDAEDWARRAEDEMVRGVYIDRAKSGRLTFDKALDRYLSEVTPTKRATSQKAERVKAIPLRSFFGPYSLAAISSELVARYRDERRRR